MPFPRQPPVPLSVVDMDDDASDSSGYEGELD